MTITALFIGLGSIGTRHLQNLAALCEKNGWTLQADALRSDLARPLRPGAAELRRVGPEELVYQAARDGDLAARLDG